VLQIDMFFVVCAAFKMVTNMATPLTNLLQGEEEIIKGLQGEDEGDMFLSNVDKHQQDHTIKTQK
jgi:hypothetical protein